MNKIHITLIASIGLSGFAASAQAGIFNNPGNILIANTGDYTRWGGTVGAGVEFGFAPNWSAGVEYDHLFMQDANVGFVTTGGFPFGFDNTRQDVDMVTARINYRFGPTIGKYGY